MLIGTYFPRPKTPIELRNADGRTFTSYYFTPVDPLVPGSEHVCEITDPKHIQDLLAIKEGYYISQAGEALAAARAAAEAIARPPAPVIAAPVVPVAAAVAPVAPTVAVAANGPAAAGTTEGSTDTPPGDKVGEGEGDSQEAQEARIEAARTTEATALLGLPLAQFKAEVKKVDPAIVRRALEIETAKPEADQRETVTKALRNELKAD